LKNVRARAWRVCSFLDGDDQWNFDKRMCTDGRNDSSHSKQENWHEYLSFAIISALATPSSYTGYISLENAEDFLKSSCSLKRYEQIDEVLRQRPGSGIMLPFSVAMLLVMNQLLFSHFSS
jgi:hypothetical protein